VLSDQPPKQIPIIKEEAIAIHMKVLKATRDSAEQDYEYLVQEDARKQLGLNS
jgi:hypothetical protein